MIKTVPTKNPSLYRQLSIPFESEQLAQDAFDAFAKDLGEIREKHKIADVVCIIEMSCFRDGTEGIVSASMAFGDPMKKAVMLAQALGSERENLMHALDVLAVRQK